ncbi:hypothetical protein [Qipengyuania flava]|uniref:hypothetical protein n=1 Tax=Qipengyuania flava TaxID=192812 RepID=UPI0012FDC8BC|nr:hypothetical protein [Qipengyuania flava]
MQAIDTPWARGTVAAGFEPVAAAFANAPRAGTALGAARTIIHRGETVSICRAASVTSAGRMVSKRVNWRKRRG